jgi:hypothetical protein
MHWLLIPEVSEWSREWVISLERSSKCSGGRAGSGERKGVQLPGQVPKTNRTRVGTLTIFEERGGIHFSNTDSSPFYNKKLIRLAEVCRSVTSSFISPFGNMPVEF